MAPSRGAKPRMSSKQRDQDRVKNVSANQVPTKQPRSALGGSIQERKQHALQQDVLDIFSHAFPWLLDPNHVQERLEPLLQQVKQHLYRRDFAAAFGKNELLCAYAARWSSSRALAYLEIFKQVLPRVTSTSQEDINVVCLGGGAGAEFAALAALTSVIAKRENAEMAIDGISEDTQRRINVQAVDIADWSTVLTRLHGALASQPQSQESRQAALDTCSPSFSLCQIDLLSLVGSNTEDHLLVRQWISNASLLTLMFTLNELYTTSISRTQAFLLELTRLTSHNTILLVVDSPGSYSTIELVGRKANEAKKHDGVAKIEPKKYPMSWLLDHALTKLALEMNQGGESSDEESAEHAKESDAPPPWEKISTDSSTWFRLPPGLRYAIPLENMRYQLHMYRRVC